jgi:D-proline reductase (dithiol) PrdB
MCHQSVGLVQGAIENAGISTVSVTVRPEVTINMALPRAAYVRFPTGNPVGQPHMPNQQRTILRGVLKVLEVAPEPGIVYEMPYRWRRMPDIDVERVSSSAEGLPAESGTVSYRIARGHIEELESRYVALMDALDGYKAWLERAVAGERRKPDPDAAKIQALVPQLRYVAELQSALEGPAHDGLVRVSDRVIRIAHWERGEFL